MKSVNNIWKISDKGGKETRVTNHGDGNLFFPSYLSADGKTIVIEDNFGLWKLDTASRKSSEDRDRYQGLIRRRTSRSWSPSARRRASTFRPPTSAAA